MTPKRKRLEVRLGTAQETDTALPLSYSVRSTSGATSSATGYASETVEIFDPETGYLISLLVQRNGEVEALSVRAEKGFVSPREVRRLPLSTYVEAAHELVAGSDPTRKVVLPRGRPARGRSTKFYREILTSYRTLKAQGEKSPVRHIAQRKSVSENTVHQWMYRARKLEEGD